MSSPILFVLASLIWGSTFWAITLQLGEAPDAVSVVYRFGMASAVLFAMCRLRGDRLWLPWNTQRWLILQGFTGFGLSYVCTYGAENYLVSALVALLFALMVFWTPIFGRIAFGTPLTWSTWCAASVAVCGVVLLFYRSISAAYLDLMSGGKGHFLLGFCLALAATLFSTVGNTMVVHVRRHSSNLFLTMAWAMLWGTLLSAAWVLASGQAWVLPARPSYWISLLYLALFGSVIAFSAYFTLIDRIGPEKAVYVGVVTPVISVLLSIYLEHFRPAAIEWCGMVLCLSSVAWALRTGGKARPAAGAHPRAPDSIATAPADMPVAPPSTLSTAHQEAS